jgi:hypothetical protein
MPTTSAKQLKKQTMTLCCYAAILIAAQSAPVASAPMAAAASALPLDRAQAELQSAAATAQVAD